MSRLLALLALAPALIAAAPAPVTPAEMSATVKEIASDPYQGRAPGTPGETKTVAYLIERLKALGVQPGGSGGAWTQAVPMIHDVAGTPTRLTVAVGGTTLAPVPGTDIAPGTTRATDRVTIADAPMVFVGYGVSAPERGWDDFKGVDLHGKIAIFLVNDPDYAAGPGEDAYGKFGGQAMTYYGRWTYKYEEAARRGALGALIVHKAGPAGYGWNVAGNVVGGTYALPVGPGQPQPVALQSWIAQGFAKTLFAKAGLDLDALEVEARSAAFRPVPLAGARLSIDMPVASTRIESQNVLGAISGTTRRGETVLFGAHWDAYGVGAPDAQGRTIRPGANDDGLGVAALLGLARAFEAGPRPKRTLVFGFWTAEERGLLGSEYYAQHPVYPIDTTVAALTDRRRRSARHGAAPLLRQRGQLSPAAAVVLLQRSRDLGVGGRRVLRRPPVGDHGLRPPDAGVGQSRSLASMNVGLAGPPRRHVPLEMALGNPDRSKRRGKNVYILLS